MDLEDRMENRLPRTSGIESTLIAIAGCGPMFAVAALCFNVAVLNINLAIRRHMAIEEVMNKRTAAIASRMVDFYGNNDGHASKEEWRLIYDSQGVPYDQSLNYSDLRKYIQEHSYILPHL